MKHELKASANCLKLFVKKYKSCFNTRISLYQARAMHKVKNNEHNNSIFNEVQW